MLPYDSMIVDKNWEERKPIVNEIINILLKNNLSYDGATLILQHTQAIIGQLKISL